MRLYTNVGFILILIGSAIGAPIKRMKPIVESTAVKKKSVVLKKNTAPVKKNISNAIKKKNVENKKVEKKVEVVDISLLNKIASQYSVVKSQRQKLENSKKILIEELAKKESAFIASIPEYDQLKHQQSLLLAISSDSLDDFVHKSIVMNYLKPYIINKNQIFMNFIKNIQNLNFQIKNYMQIENELIQKWHIEKRRVDSIQKK